jgi:hypothetical protein
VKKLLPGLLVILAILWAAFDPTGAATAVHHIGTFFADIKSGR